MLLIKFQEDQELDFVKRSNQIKIILTLMIQNKKIFLDPIFENQIKRRQGRRQT